jgi:hypothetical protein
LHKPGYPRDVETSLLISDWLVYITMAYVTV